MRRVPEGPIRLPGRPRRTRDHGGSAWVRALLSVANREGISPLARDLQSLEVEIRTERTATTVENLGCTAPDQPRPR